MSALGQKRTFAVQNGMSALPPKADILWLRAVSRLTYLDLEITSDKALYRN
jgi:hypothetical protein